jgi:hypothetical protein
VTPAAHLPSGLRSFSSQFLYISALNCLNCRVAPFIVSGPIVEDVRGDV